MSNTIIIISPVTVSYVGLVNHTSTVVYAFKALSIVHVMLITVHRIGPMQFIVIVFYFKGIIVYFCLRIISLFCLTPHDMY